MLLFSLLLMFMSLASFTLAKTLPNKNDFLVTGLEEIEPAYATFNGTMYAGLLPVEPVLDDDNDSGNGEGEGGDYMFWLFQPNQPESTDSIVMWFNGGPGCSSFHAGMLSEMGPVTTQLHPAGYFAPRSENNNPFIENKYAWTKVTTVLFVEQPFPVGFSHGGPEPRNETDVGRYFYNFLQNFYQVFGDEQYKKRIYIVGESYGGMYIPGVAHYIYEQNNKVKHQQQQEQEQTTMYPTRFLNLAGIAVGNGWVDATIQGPAVIDYAWWHGMIDSVTKDALWAEWHHCKKHILDSATTHDREPAPFHGFTVPDECGIMEAVLSAAGAGLLPRGNPNTYDVTTWDPYDLLSNDDNSNTRFFNNLKVQEILHVHPLGIYWMGCIPGAGRRRLHEQEEQQQEQASPPSNNPLAISKPPLPSSSALPRHRRRRLHLLDDDRPISVAPYIADLLDEAQIYVLIYNGDRDLSACVTGSEMVLDRMKWSGQADWLDPDRYQRGLWLADAGAGADLEQERYLDHPIMSGYAKVVKNLQFLMVYNSGHLVPTNRPKASLDLIRRVVHNESFIDKVIPVVYKAPPPKPKTGWSEGASRQETTILVLLAFAFGYATSVCLSKIHGKCFTKPKDGYEKIPSTSSH